MTDQTLHLAFCRAGDLAGFCCVGGLDPVETVGISRQSNGSYRLAIARKHVAGDFPITENFFIGDQAELERKAEELK